MAITHVQNEDKQNITAGAGRQTTETKTSWNARRMEWRKTTPRRVRKRQSNLTCTVHGDEEPSRNVKVSSRDFETAFKIHLSIILYGCQTWVSQLKRRTKSEGL
jgi:hypothetical protein